MTNRERGFGPPVELMFFIAAIGIVSAIWAPQIAKRGERAQRNECARRLDASLEAPEVPQSCPVSNLALVLSTGRDGIVVSCPAPKEHGLGENGVAQLSASRHSIGQAAPQVVLATPKNPLPMSLPKVIGGWLASVVGAVVLVAGGVELLSRIG